MDYWRRLMKMWSTVRLRLLLGLIVAALLTAGLLGLRFGSAAAATQPAKPATAGTLAASETSSDPVPPEIQVPPGNRLVARLNARGVQIYQCTTGAWSFLEPAAVLSDWTPAAIHFRGPSWESTRDGSLVEARAVASSPVPGSIPQLLLQSTRTRGDGIFGAVTYIQRLKTTGGVAPTTACTDGQTAGVAYTAEYRFYAAS
jgi:hypothetical protein